MPFPGCVTFAGRAPCDGLNRFPRVDFSSRTFCSHQRQCDGCARVHLWVREGVWSSNFWKLPAGSDRLNAYFANARWRGARPQAVPAPRGVLCLGWSQANSGGAPASVAGEGPPCGAFGDDLVQQHREDGGELYIPKWVEKECSRRAKESKCKHPRGGGRGEQRIWGIAPLAEGS